MRLRLGQIYRDHGILVSGHKTGHKIVESHRDGYRFIGRGVRRRQTGALCYGDLEVLDRGEDGPVVVTEMMRPEPGG
jgi:hypothetical protein